MNDDEPPLNLDALKSEHRELDERIKVMIADPESDQLEVARMKKRKLRLKDQIQQMLDSQTPDLIA